MLLLAFECPFAEVKEGIRGILNEHGVDLTQYNAIMSSFLDTLYL
jgi:hypothetical protein